MTTDATTTTAAAEPADAPATHATLDGVGPARRARRRWRNAMWSPPMVAMLVMALLSVTITTLLMRVARRGERGQGTVEYALILLGAAAVALAVVAWVARTDLVGRLFDTVVGRILERA